MSFEIFTEGRGRPSTRLPEVQAMLETLEADPELTARIDLDRARTHELAKQLGYKVSVADNKDGTVNVTLRARA